MGPDELDDLLASIRAESKKESALALYEGVREDDLVDENVDERVLKLLGLNEVFDIDYGTYVTLLKERLAASRSFGKKLSTEEDELLVEEFRKVKGKVGRFKIKRKKITAENIGVTGPVKVSTERFYLTSKAIIPQPASVAGEQSGDVKDISEALDRLLKSITEQNKAEKKKAEESRKEDEQKKRVKRESELEKPIKKAFGLVKKIVAPFQSILDRIMKFIQFTFLGFLVDKVLKWFADPANEKKVKILGRFLKDWWPALAFGAGLFLTPLGKFVRTTLTLLRGWIPKIAGFLLKNPWIAGAALMTTAGIVGMQQRKQKEEALFPEKDKQGKPIQKTTQQRVSEVQKKAMIQIGDPMGAGPIGSTFSGGGRVRRKSFFGGGAVDKIVNVRDIAFEEGGGINDGSGLRITGAGPDTQLIAAQPGEIVMSKKAVDKYGSNFFLNINKRAGGTNIPKMANNIQLAAGGGLIKRTIKTFQGGGMIGYSPDQVKSFMTVYNLSKKHGAKFPELQASIAMKETGWLKNMYGNNAFNQRGTNNKFLNYKTLEDAVKDNVRLWDKHREGMSNFSDFKDPVSAWNANASAYAPPGENDTEKYKADVSNMIRQMKPIYSQTVKSKPKPKPKSKGNFLEYLFSNINTQLPIMGPQSRAMPVATPTIISRTQTIVLPPQRMPGQKPSVPVKTGTQIPDVSVVARIPHRERVIRSLGISDLMGVG